MFITCVCHYWCTLWFTLVQEQEPSIPNFLIWMWLLTLCLYKWSPLSTCLFLIHFDTSCQLFPPFPIPFPYFPFSILYIVLQCQMFTLNTAVNICKRVYVSQNLRLQAALNNSFTILLYFLSISVSNWRRHNTDFFTQSPAPGTVRLQSKTTAFSVTAQ